MLNMFICWRCGRDVECETEPQERVYCRECAEKAKEEKKQLLDAYTEIRKKVMFETALRKMEKAGMYMHEYLEISEEVFRQFNADDIKLMSGDEIIAAMVLRSYLIDYKANYRIGSYVVDFLIPSMHVVLEIDGDRHDLRPDKDNARDINLRAMLGEKWEVIRIGTPYLEMNPEKLPDAIEILYAEKKKLREKNNGIIPEYYSKREKRHYAQIAPKKKVSKTRWDNF